MAIFGYDGFEAVKALNEAIENNDDLKEKFARANEEVNHAFTNNGAVLGGALGEICAGIWNAGSRNSFETKLRTKTEAFLMQKVLPIINESDKFHQETTQAYSSTLQQAREI